MLEVSLPNFRLPSGRLSSGLLGHGDFHAALRWVHALPYGRNSVRDDFSLVLTEQRGTCSTKHALLAALAREARVHVPLRTGIYLMNDLNTPGTGPTLRAHGLACVPEAHCFLLDGETRVDLTFPRSEGTCLLTFIEEREITPEEIGAVKLNFHRAFVERWARAENLDPEAVWTAREACIAALSLVNRGEFGAERAAGG